MALSYLGRGASISAEHMTELFAALETKLDAAYDGKSFLLSDVLSGARPQMGRTFVFLNTDKRIWSGGLGDNYDHSYYTAMADAATIDAINEEKKIVSVSGINILGGFGDGGESELDYSLEAHTRNGYFLQPSFYPTPEKIYQYAVAELVFEGDGFQIVNFPARYNKFNFFRIHNLNWYPMKFVFEGSGYTVEIPGYGCKTVRRDNVMSGYNSEWKYLWQFYPGDPRFLYNLGMGQLYATMAVNNVTNPAGLLHSWIELLRQAGHFFLDPHEQFDCKDLYSGIFPDPADVEQLIGNFFHHRGQLKIGNVTRTFRGYETIQADLPEITFADIGSNLQITAVQSGTGQLTTNLFNQHDASTPFLSTLPQNLDSTNTGRGEFNLVYQDAISYFVPGSTIELTVDTINYVPASTSPANIVFHLETLDDVLTLNHFGDSSFDADDQETNLSTITNRELLLTPWGPRIQFSQTVAVDGSYNQGNATASDLFTNPMHEISGTSLVCKGSVQFTGWGWGRIVTDAFGNRTFYPAFLSPRVPRAIATNLIEDGLIIHPHIYGDRVGLGNGQDFQLRSITDNYSPTQYAFMASIDLDDSNPLAKGNFNWWKSPDIISTWPTLVPMIVEHYNAMAAAVNSVKKIQPITFAAFQIWLDSIGAVQLPAPNNNGVLGTAICPREMYCSFAFGSVEHLAFLELGVPIRTSDDLPTDLIDILDDTSPLLYWGAAYDDTVTAATPPNYTADRSYVGEINGYINAGGFRDGAFGFAPRFDPTPIFGMSASTSDPTLYWVKIEDVKRAAEDRGFKFTYQFTGHVYRFDLIAVGPDPELLYPLPTGTASYSFVDSNSYSVGAVIHRDSVFQYHGRAGYLVEDPDGEWKGPLASSFNSVSDIIPGDVGPNGYIDEAFGVGIAWKFALSDDQYLALGEYHPGTANARKHVLIQNVYSAGFTNESVAFLLPTPWANNAQTNFSELSRADLESRISGGKEVITIEALPKAGVTEVVSLVQGDTVIDPRTDGFLEVVPCWRTLINV